MIMISGFPPQTLNQGTYQKKHAVTRLEVKDARVCRKGQATAAPNSNSNTNGDENKRSSNNSRNDNSSNDDNNKTTNRLVWGGEHAFSRFGGVDDVVLYLFVRVFGKTDDILG